MKKFSITFFDENQVDLDKLSVSAVFLVAISSGGMLVTRNERGWDIPGGHLEKGETPYGALKREVMEEVGALIKKAEPYAIISEPGAKEVMLFFFTNSFELADFFPKPDAFEREVIEPEKFLEKYYGDKTLMLQLVEKAKKLIK